MARRHVQRGGDAARILRTVAVSSEHPSPFASDLPANSSKAAITCCHRPMCEVTSHGRQPSRPGAHATCANSMRACIPKKNNLRTRHTELWQQGARTRRAQHGLKETAVWRLGCSSCVPRLAQNKCIEQAQQNIQAALHLLKPGPRGPYSRASPRCRLGRRRADARALCIPASAIRLIAGCLWEA